MLVALAFAFTVRVARAQDYNREDHGTSALPRLMDFYQLSAKTADDIVANDHDDGEREQAR
jgi:hypothetical protein